MTTHLSTNIKALRESHSLSQEALAEEICVSRQSVQSWESGRMEPKLCTAVKLAKYFKVSVEELMIVKKSRG